MEPSLEIKIPLQPDASRPLGGSGKSLTAPELSWALCADGILRESESFAACIRRLAGHRASGMAENRECLPVVPVINGETETIVAGPNGACGLPAAFQQAREIFVSLENGFKEIRKGKEDDAFPPCAVPGLMVVDAEAEPAPTDADMDQSTVLGKEAMVVRIEGWAPGPDASESRSLRMDAGHEAPETTPVPEETGRNGLLPPVRNHPEVALDNATAVELLEAGEEVLVPGAMRKTWIGGGQVDKMPSEGGDTPGFMEADRNHAARSTETIIWSAERSKTDFKGIGVVVPSAENETAPQTDSSGKAFMARAEASDKAAIRETFSPGGPEPARAPSMDETAWPLAWPAETAGPEKADNIEAPRPAPESHEMRSLSDVIEKAVLHQENGQSRIKIQLKPAFLGHLHLNVMMEHSKVTVEIRTETLLARDFLETNLHGLKAELQSSGLEIDKIDVLVDPDLNSRQEQGGASAFKQTHRPGGHAREMETPAADVHADSKTLIFSGAGENRVNCFV